MAGIINWNELWKTMRTGHYWGKAHEKDADSRLECAKKFREWAMRDREQAEKQIAPIKLKPEYTVLDVGAGPGRLAIPIAKRVKSVTAIDQSKEMLACLQENMEKEGIKNIVCINKRWEDIEVGEDIEPHDVVMACHSLGMFDIQEALAKMDAAAKRYVYILSSAGRGMGNGEEEGLWKAIYGEREHRARGWGSDYMFFCNLLHDMKIYANVDIRDAEFEQRYESLDDAVTKWKEMRDIPTEKEEVLREYLTKILVEDDGTGTLRLKRKSKSATIWWQKADRGGVIANT
ncbi:putative cobalt-precorrin-6B C(15)-methyltransferase (decarboxylating) [ANME-1 cluster archaeon GoMg1]|nr:putative cobalt-precorrin-6B C(15)-methyltransferase (decarboxylating) [ANME-1 cluster archaeon GoMg1]